MKTTTLSLRGVALAALLVASPAAGVIDFTFNQMTVPLKAGFDIDDDDNIDFGTSGNFSITDTDSGLTMTVSMSGTAPDVNPTGLFIAPKQGGTVVDEDLIIMTFDKPVTIDSITVGRLQFPEPPTLNAPLLVSISGPDGTGTPVPSIEIPTSLTTFPTTYSMPASFDGIEVKPDGTNEFRINGNSTTFADISGVAVTVVPEPESVGILVGLAGLAFVFARRRRS